MAKLVLNDIDSLANTASAKQALNENFTDIEAAIENTLSRNGATPNQMQADIDMNSNDLLNAGRVDAVEFYKNGVPFEQTVAYANKLYDVFSGTGAQTEFEMQTDPGSLGNLYVSVGGSDLKPGIDYNYNGTTLTFVVAPAAGTNNIYVRYDRALATEDSVLRQDLALTTTGKGAELVAFKQAGTGAVVRDLQGKSRERVTPQDYGAVADGVEDDTAAINAAVAYAIATGKLAIYLPAGRYRITSKIDIALTGFKGFAIEGEGMGITEVLVDYAGGNGFEIVASDGNYWLDVDQHAAVRLANFTLVTNRVDVGTGILVDGGSLAGRPPQACVFDHVEFRGATSFFHAFSVCVDLLDAASAQFIGCRWLCGGPGVYTADGVRIRCSISGNDPTEFKFTDCEWYFCDVGVRAGDYVEGVYFNNPTMVNCNVGIYYVTTSGESGMAVNGGHFNCFSRNIEVQNVFDISITGPIMFHADASAGFRHISFDNCGAFTVQGHVMRGGATDIGVYVNNVPVGWAGTIGPGHYSGLGAGPYLDSNSRNVTVSNGSSYVGMPDRVVDAGTGNDVQLKAYTIGIVKALAGGAPTETFDVAIPAGLFIAKPNTGVVQVSGAFNLSATFDQASGSSTATNARCVAIKPDGTNIGAGNYQFNVTLYGE